MYKHLLIVVDARAESRAAIQEGLRLAQVHGAEVTFFTMAPRYPVLVADGPAFDIGASQQFDEAAKAGADMLLAAAHAEAERAQVMSHGTLSRGEDGVLAIIEAARRRRCEVIVVAAEGHNALVRLLTGSVIPGLITSSPIPVLVCKPPERPASGRRAKVLPLKPRSAATGTNDGAALH